MLGMYIESPGRSPQAGDKPIKWAFTPIHLKNHAYPAPEQRTALRAVPAALMGGQYKLLLSTLNALHACGASSQLCLTIIIVINFDFKVVKFDWIMLACYNI